MYLSFFFFKAEDGIRDSSVTGVQTCALPISPEEAAKHLQAESVITLVQRTDSACRCLAASSGVEPTTSAPMALKRSSTSGCFISATKTWLSFLTMAGGVLAGMKTANQGETS